MEEKNLIYECPYCNQKGGKRLGIDKDGNEVCDKCGKYDIKYYKFVHFPEWSWDNSVSNNKTLKKNNTSEQDDK